MKFDRTNKFDFCYYGQVKRIIWIVKNFMNQNCSLARKKLNRKKWRFKIPSRSQEVPDEVIVKIDAFPIMEKSLEFTI